MSGPWFTSEKPKLVRHSYIKIQHQPPFMPCNEGSGNGCGMNKFGQMCSDMGGYAPDTLKAIRELDPEFIETIHTMDRVMVNDGALDKKTKRLMALACVTVRMCEDCVYAQAKVAKNYGASKREILEAINVAVLTGGMPCWSTAKKGISKLFAEWDE